MLKINSNILKTKIPNFGFFKREFRVLFFGSDEFSGHVLKRLYDEMRWNKVENERIVKKLGVVCLNTEKKLPVLDLVNKYDLPYYEYPKIPDDYDIGIVASFGKLIPKSIINSFANGAINVHPSLLPKLRGAAPILSVILQNEQYTGVSIMKITPDKFDQGPILAQTEPILIPCHVPHKDITNTLANYGSDLLLDTLSSYSFKLKHMREQHEIGDGIATYAKKLLLKPIKFDLENTPFQTISAHVRAHGHLKQCNVLAELAGYEVKLYEVELPSLEEMCLLAPLMHIGGHRDLEYSKTHNRLYINTATTKLGIKSLALKGKKQLTAKDFFNGYLQAQGYKSVQEKLHERQY